MTETKNRCPYAERCPLFPLFVSQPVRRIYQISYCENRFEDCERYKLASTGGQPDPRLLPDGKTLREA